LEYIMSHVGDKLNRVLRSEVVSMNFKLSPGAETDMEKLKDLILQGGKNSGVEDSEHISVFVKKKIQDTYHWMPAGSVYVHEVQDNTARVSHTGRNAEEEMLAEALKDDAEIVVTYSDLPSLELPQNDKAINLAVKRKSVFQDISSENLEHRLPGARLIERAPDYDLEYFLEKAKEERFMDQTGIDQESQIGAEYLMETTVEKYKLIDIKSSKILFDAERFISLTGLQSKYDFLNKWNEFFDVGMELIEVMDGNEKKVKEVMVQSLLDLRKITYLDVFHVQSESVGGKSIERLVKVGQLWPKKDLGGNMFECKVTDGNKELRELIDAGEDLIIKIKVKKGKEAGKLKKLMLEAAKEAERSK